MRNKDYKITHQMKWTDQEKEQLAELVKLNIVNGRIMWIKIGQVMGRTAN